MAFILSCQVMIGCFFFPFPLLRYRDFPRRHFLSWMDGMDEHWELFPWYGMPNLPNLTWPRPPLFALSLARSGSMRRHGTVRGNQGWLQ